MASYLCGKADFLSDDIGFDSTHPDWNQDTAARQTIIAQWNNTAHFVCARIMVILAHLLHPLWFILPNLQRSRTKGRTRAKYQQREDICAIGFLQTGAELQAHLNLQNVFIMSTDRWRSGPFVAVDIDQIFSLHINWRAGAQFLSLCGFVQRKQALVLGSSKRTPCTSGKWWLVVDFGRVWTLQWKKNKKNQNPEQSNVSTVWLCSGIKWPIFTQIWTKGWEEHRVQSALTSL